MKTKTLVPENFTIPDKLETLDFLIRKLKESDAKLDYEAVMSSIDIIHKIRGGTWPSKALILDEDVQDLTIHQNEFENRVSFAFTVMNPTETECLGCIYFYPIGTRKKAPNTADVDVSFWVTQKAYNMGLYDKLYKIIREWLSRDWPFKNPFWTNDGVPQI